MAHMARDLEQRLKVTQLRKGGGSVGDVRDTLIAFATLFNPRRPSFVKSADPSASSLSSSLCWFPFWPLNLLWPSCLRHLVDTLIQEESTPIPPSPLPNNTESFLSWLHNSFHHLDDNLLPIAPNLTFQPARHDWTCTDYISAAWISWKDSSSFRYAEPTDEEIIYGVHDWINYYAHHGCSTLEDEEDERRFWGRRVRLQQYPKILKILNDGSLKDWRSWKKGLNGMRCVGIGEQGNVWEGVEGEKKKGDQEGGVVYCVDLPWVGVCYSFHFRFRLASSKCKSTSLTESLIYRES
ncbi:hypothetical protein AC578_4131 [Pseudocercospora eumusae]|uniref:Uncharacterized protein n=1 Tax=Pseudocercospora eumusae TaxID=321146 RepID=A0A139HF21_9PEZI|nr:hypothetical protein AC578_4131 [Pseudocercospora eumusae]